jgi:hypothetical protein
MLFFAVLYCKFPFYDDNGLRDNALTVGVVGSIQIGPVRRVSVEPSSLAGIAASRVPGRLPCIDRQWH